MIEQTKTTRGAWLTAHGEELAQAALSRIAPNASELTKLAAFKGLAAKLQYFREYDRWDPCQMESVVLKSDYRIVEDIDLGGLFYSLQVLPTGEIFVGYNDGNIGIWTKNSEGSWSAKFLEGHEDVVVCLKVLPDGRIISAGDDGTLRIWTKEEGQWTHQVLNRRPISISSLQVFSDGRILCGNESDRLRIWTKQEDGKWHSKALKIHGKGIKRLLALPDGRIAYVSGKDKGQFGDCSLKIKTGHRTDHIDDASNLDCLTAFPDGRIVLAGGCEIRIYGSAYKQGDSPEVIACDREIECLQALPDGRMVSGCSEDPILHIWTRAADGTWGAEELQPKAQKQDKCCWYQNVQVLPDGRIVLGWIRGEVDIQVGAGRIHILDGERV